MDGFLSMTRSRSGLPWPTINVCECNADVSDDGSRPQFFGNLAQWRYSNGGRRMLTFFPDPAGPHSVSWEVYRVWGVITPGPSWFVPAKISTPSRDPRAVPELPVMYADIAGRRDLVRRA